MTSTLPKDNPASKRPSIPSKVTTNTHKPPLTATNSSSSSTTNTSTFRRTDVVKSGRLFLMKSCGLFNLKDWHERVLVLRDTWTEACQSGVTSLEVYYPPINSSPKLLNRIFQNPEKSSFISLFSCISSKTHKAPLKNSSKETQGSLSKYSHNSLPRNKHSSKNHIDHCYIDLSTVTSVDAFSSNKTFPHAFVLHRKDKESVIFGAKTEFEAREWLMAIKHLADKVHQPSVPLRTVPGALTFEDRLEIMRRRSRDEILAESEVFLTKSPESKKTNEDVPMPPPRLKPRIPKV